MPKCARKRTLFRGLVQIYLEGFGAISANSKFEDSTATLHIGTKNSRIQIIEHRRPVLDYLEAIKKGADVNRFVDVFMKDAVAWAYTYTGGYLTIELFPAPDEHPTPQFLLHMGVNWGKPIYVYCTVFEKMSVHRLKNKDGRRSDAFVFTELIIAQDEGSSEDITN